MANLTALIEIKIADLNQYKKALELLTAVAEAGDQLLSVDEESPAYPALKNIYDVARADLMRFEYEVEHEKDN